jgi:hypothetical protein
MSINLQSSLAAAAHTQSSRLFISTHNLVRSNFIQIQSVKEENYLEAIT